VPMFCFCGDYRRKCHHLVASAEEQIVQCGRNRRMNHRLICEGKIKSTSCMQRKGLHGDIMVEHNNIQKTRFDMRQLYPYVHLLLRVPNYTTDKVVTSKITFRRSFRYCSSWALINISSFHAKLFNPPK
jgi:hypothetical protein